MDNKSPQQPYRITDAQIVDLTSDESLDSDSLSNPSRSLDMDEETEFAATQLNFVGYYKRYGEILERAIQNCMEWSLYAEEYPERAPSKKDQIWDLASDIIWQIMDADIQHGQSDME